LFGGKPGSSGSFTLVHGDGAIEKLPAKPTSMALPEDASLVVETPGGGGYGAPARRAAEQIARDRRYAKYGGDEEPERITRLGSRS
jgi:N-methylhydantoinase B